MRDNAAQALSNINTTMSQRYITLLLDLLEDGNPDSRRTKAEELWRGILNEKMSPLTIDNRAYFFYYGRAESVSLAGDWTYWQPGAYLNRVEHTDLFYAIQEFDIAARLQYKMIVNGEWQLDEANPRSTVEGFGVNSEFLMPGYVDNSWLVPQGKRPQKGHIERLMTPSVSGYRPHELFLYVPNEHYRRQTEDLPLLLMHDGAESLRIGRFHEIIDNLLAGGKIEPFAAAFLTPGDRISEYALDARYPDYCAHEVLPFAVSCFAERNIIIAGEAKNHSVGGASLGGLLATKTALEFPDSFGVAIAQSPSYWWNQGEIFRSRYLKNAPNIKFILQTGTVCDAQRLTQLMHLRLNGLGATAHYSEFPQGHTWGNWRSNFAEALMNWKPTAAKLAA